LATEIVTLIHKFASSTALSAANDNFRLRLVRDNATTVTLPGGTTNPTYNALNQFQEGLALKSFSRRVPRRVRLPSHYPLNRPLLRPQFLENQFFLNPLFRGRFLSHDV
jgi:hypothetical protein